MTFDLIPIGSIMHIPIEHGVVHLGFEDYYRLLEKLRGERPDWCEVYTSSSEPGRDYMLGFDFHWNGKGNLSGDVMERLSFEKLWNLFDENWDWGCKEEKIGGWHNKDGTYEPRRSILSWKYTEVVFQTHQAGACAFNRVTGKVTGTGMDLNAMKEVVTSFEEHCRNAPVSWSAR